MNPQELLTIIGRCDFVIKRLQHDITFNDRMLQYPDWMNEAKDAQAWLEAIRSEAAARLEAMMKASNPALPKFHGL